MAAKLTMKQGEAKTITFTAKDAAGVVVDLSLAAISLGVKLNKSDTAYAIFKADADFDKSLTSTGVIKVDFDATDTDLSEGTYIGELQFSWTSGATVNKTVDWYLQIKGAVIPAA